MIRDSGVYLCIYSIFIWCTEAEILNPKRVALREVDGVVKGSGASLPGNPESWI